MENKFKCSKCESEFTRKDNLKKHLFIHERNGKKKIFHCGQCPYTSRTKASFQQRQGTYRHYAKKHFGVVPNQVLKNPYMLKSDFEELRKLNETNEIKNNWIDSCEIEEKDGKIIFGEGYWGNIRTFREYEGVEDIKPSKEVREQKKRELKLQEKEKELEKEKGKRKRSNEKIIKYWKKKVAIRDEEIQKLKQDNNEKDLEIKKLKALIRRSEKEGKITIKRIMKSRN